MNNINKKGEIHSCSGCGMCYAVCPTDAISIIKSDEGFYIPKVNDEKCVECGKCLNTCYKYDKNYKINSGCQTPICFSAKNKSKRELQNCSSGGVSIELMRQCINDGYKVVGVAYDYEKEIAITKIATTEKELEQFKGSKYFQSFTINALKELIKDHSDSKYAIFGTPCQIYAISKYAERTNSENKFLLIDIFCHGCPSILLWENYLKQKKSEYNTSKFDKIKFRSKTYGWHEYCFDFKSKNKQYCSSKIYDPFYELFFSMDVMNKACYDCVARSSIEKSDIRIGDFWGTKYDKDMEGVSAVVICTEKGNKLFEKVKNKFDCEEANFNEIIEAQSYGKEHVMNKEIRNITLNSLQSDTLKKTIKKHRKVMPKKKRLKDSIKRIIKHIPNRQFFALRAFVHRIGL